MFVPNENGDGPEIEPLNITEEFVTFKIEAVTRFAKMEDMLDVSVKEALKELLLRLTLLDPVTLLKSKVQLLDVEA